MVKNNAHLFQMVQLVEKSRHGALNWMVVLRQLYHVHLHKMVGAIREKISLWVQLIVRLTRSNFVLIFHNFTTDSCVPGSLYCFVLGLSSSFFARQL